LIPERFRLLRLEIAITAVLVGIYLLFIIGNPKVFTRFDIYYSLMSTIPLWGIMALAMTLVVTLGEIDLSFPSVLAFSAWMFGKVFEVTGNIWLAVLVCFAVGVAAGILNSFLIVRIGIPSLVATIGTMFFFRGAVNVVAQGKGIPLVKAKETLFYELCVGRIFDLIPAQAVWMIALGAGFWFLLNRHRFGSHILFVGDNEESSRMMGIHVEGVKTTVFMQMGFFAAFGGCRAESSAVRVNECTATYFECFWVSTSNPLHLVWNTPDVSLFNLAVSCIPTWQRTPKNPIHNQASE